MDFTKSTKDLQIRALNSATPGELLVEKSHQGEQHKQKDRQQPYLDVVGNETEQRRHQAGAGIGTGHLDADQRLGAVSAEVSGGGVDDAGINGSAAQADEQQSHQRTG